MINEKGKNREERLLPRVLHSGFWASFLRVLQILLTGVKLIVLARVLSPAEFGIVGIALLTVDIMVTFSNTGFQSALINKKEDITSYLNTAWTVLIIRGALLFCLIYLLAPAVQVFFGVSGAVWVVRAIGAGILLESWQNIGVIYFRKELRFDREFMFRFISTVVECSVTVTLALLIRNIWAYVFGYLAGYITLLCGSYLIQPYRPHFEFDRKKAKELFSFGRWIFSSSILIFIGIHGDDIFVGKILGAAMLGFYQMAYKISNVPATQITHVISQVTFPAYSKMKENMARARESVLRVLKFTTFLSFPIGAFIFIAAHDFTAVFLGDKWLPIVPTMQILAVYGITRAVNACFGSFFQGIGKPEVITKVSLLYVCLLAIMIYPFSRLGGLEGVAWAVTLANIGDFAFMVAKFRSVAGGKIRELARVLLPDMAAVTGICLLIVVCEKLFLSGAGEITRFSFCSVVGMFCYAIYGKKQISALMNIFRQKIDAKKIKNANEKDL